MRNDSSLQQNSFHEIRWKMLYSLWFLILIRPERLISYYIPSLSPLKMLPTLLLATLFVIWILTTSQKYNFKWIGFFLVITIISGLFAENTGRARWAVRFIFEIYILGIITFSYADDKIKIDSILKLVFFQFLYLAIWGIIGKGIVQWDNYLNEEDAYGPLMCIGVGYCYYYYESLEKSFLKKMALITLFLCIVGVTVSFARGAFIVLIAVLLYLLLLSKNRVKTLIVGLSSVFIILYSASVFFPENAFWTEMSSSFEGTSTGTGRDRKVLWSVAWEEFKDNPILGVGSYNFGVKAPKYIEKVSESGKYLDPSQIWGRALHNGYFQILSELGIVGASVFLMILIDFYKSNSVIRIESKNVSYSDYPIRPENDITIHKEYYHISKGIQAGVFAFLLSAFFYDILYYNWFWNLLILNRLLFINVSTDSSS
jgi:O-antigen ligase